MADAEHQEIVDTTPVEETSAPAPPPPPPADESIAAPEAADAQEAGAGAGNNNNKRPPRGGGGRNNSNNVNCHKVYVKDIPASLPDEDIKIFFSRAGPVVDFLTRDVRSNPELKYAFVGFNTKEEADAAVAFSGEEITEGRKIVVEAKQDRVCFKCNKTGHVAAACREDSRVCRTCGKAGHIAKDCRGGFRAGNVNNTNAIDRKPRRDVDRDDRRRGRDRSDSRDYRRRDRSDSRDYRRRDRSDSRDYRRRDRSDSRDRRRERSDSRGRRRRDDSRDRKRRDDSRDRKRTRHEDRDKKPQGAVPQQRL